MAEDSDMERTEAPSEKKLEQARSEGNVPRSKELATFIVLFSAGAGLWWTGSDVVMQVKSLMKNALVLDRPKIYDMNALTLSTWNDLVKVFMAFAPMAGFLLLVAAASPVLIGGWNVSAKALVPKFSRLNFFSGVTNLVSINSGVELLKAVAKTILVGFVAYIIIKKQIPSVLGMTMENVSSGTTHLVEMLWVAFFYTTGSLGLIAALDVPYQLKHYYDNLKMTKQEVRQEAREAEGDPHIKAKIRQQQREMSRRRMMSEVPNADVVVVNPTHYAVAIKYMEDGQGAPKVIAKGKDAIALKIKEIAAQHNVPVLSAPPLARALHTHTELGDEIPQTLYMAVAEVLAYVYQLKSFQTSGGVRPKEPSDIAVPVNLDPNTNMKIVTNNE